MPLWYEAQLCPQAPKLRTCPSFYLSLPMPHLLPLGDRPPRHTYQAQHSCVTHCHPQPNPDPGPMHSPQPPTQQPPSFSM